MRDVVLYVHTWSARSDASTLLDPGWAPIPRPDPLSVIWEALLGGHHQSRRSGDPSHRGGSSVTVGRER